jgi:hypothetical protein
LDVEVENLCVIAGFPRSDYVEVYEVGD